MTWSQTLVAVWIQFALGAVLLLMAARWALRWVKQPVDRIRLILWAIASTLAVPLVVLWFPLPGLRLGVVPPARPPIPGFAEERRPEAAASGRIAEADARTYGGQSPEPGRPSSAVVKIAPSPASRFHATVPTTSGIGTAEPRAPLAANDSVDYWTMAAALLMAIHGIAILMTLAEWLIGRAALKRLCAATSSTTLDLEVAWNGLPGAGGRDVELLISPAIDAPLTFGWWRPVVVVPRSLVEAGAADLRFCLAHEWSHIERHDLLAWRWTQCCQWLLWWHPSFWTLRRELRLAQDMLADARAAAIGEGSLEYSELLVGLAQQRMPAYSACALTFLDHPSQLTRRITMLLEPSFALRTRCTWKFSMAAAGTVLASLLVLGSVRLEAVQGEAQADVLVADEAAASIEVAQADSGSGPPMTQEKEKPADEKVMLPDELKYSAIVVDKSTGAGIPQATVVVRRSINSSTSRETIEETRHTTDADGKYSFVIPPEQVAERYLYIELDVEHPDYADQKNFGYALSMIVKNEKLGERPFFERVELLPSDPIRGTVLSPDGTPLAGIKLLGYSKANASDFRDYGSFTRAVTGADGKFLLKMVKGGVGVFWVTPRDFAITSRPVGKDRGDVGEIRLQTGIRETGRLLAIDGKPLANIPVNIGYQTGGTEDVNGLPVASAIRRGVLTDAEGRFAFDPLPEGEYQLTVDEYLHDPLLEGRHRQFDVTGVFVPKKVQLKDGVVPEPIQFQESPYVMFNAQIYDSKGEKTRGHEITLYGQIDGQWWHNFGKPDAEGTIAMKVPHGLEQVRVDLMSNEHGALRYRRGQGKELENRVRGIEFGTLTDDVEGFEIVRYRAPIVLVSAVDEEGQPIKGFKVGAAYSWGKQDYILEGEVRSDLSFEHQNDGRYRTSQMLPDEKVKFTVTAEGYESAAEEVSLSEGESKDLVLTMKKKAEAEE